MIPDGKSEQIQAEPIRHASENSSTIPCGPKEEITFIDLDTKDPKQMKLLDAFYDGPFSRAFPDPNECKEKSEFIRLATARDNEEIEDNGYHILLAVKNGKVIGGAVSGYSNATQSGGLEYLCIDKEYQSHGLGAALIKQTEIALKHDAIKADTYLQRILIEIDDPFTELVLPEGMLPSMSPQGRADVYGASEYKQYGCPYDQPRLQQANGEKGEPVCLRLIGQEFDKNGQIKRKEPQVGALQLLMSIENYHRDVVGVDINSKEYKQDCKRSREYLLKGSKHGGKIPLLPIQSVLWKGMKKDGTPIIAAVASGKAIKNGEVNIIGKSPHSLFFQKTAIDPKNNQIYEASIGEISPEILGEITANLRDYYASREKIYKAEYEQRNGKYFDVLPAIKIDINKLFYRRSQGKPADPVKMYEPLQRSV